MFDAGSQPAALPNIEKRLDILEEWKEKIENLPILSDKFNVGLNALQFQYFHQDAHVPEGQSQDNMFIRRSEMIFWGRINDYIPRWHALFEFQQTAITNIATGPPGANGVTPTKSLAQFFKESYIDFRPFLAAAPNLNFVRFGVFRMPWGIFTETSGGLRDVISSPYLTTVGSGGSTKNGAGGQIDFLQERDFFADARGRIKQLEYVIGIANNNNVTANGLQNFSSNGPKLFYSRYRLFATDVSFVSFTMLVGEENNAETAINGRGKGEMDRWGIDARYTSKWLPGLVVQGEWWRGHDAANQTTVGTWATGSCQGSCGVNGSGSQGSRRQTWYAYAKYLFTEGPLENWEPIVMYDWFNPNTAVSNDIYYRTILGTNYYFQNLPPKIQTKLQINYEFRHHAGNGPGAVVDPTRGVGDPFAQNTFLVQLQVRYM
jgi:hypothetical protein